MDKRRWMVATALLAGCDGGAGGAGGDDGGHGDGEAIPGDVLSYWPIDGDRYWKWHRDSEELRADIISNNQNNTKGWLQVSGADMDQELVLEIQGDQLVLVNEGAEELVLLASGDRVGASRDNGEMAVSLVGLEACENDWTSGWECLRMRLEGGPLPGDLWLAPDWWAARWLPESEDEPWILYEAHYNPAE